METVCAERGPRGWKDGTCRVEWEADTLLSVTSGRGLAGRAGPSKTQSVQLNFRATVKAL